MKAKERIKRYGMEKYIRTCLHREPDAETVKQYKEKYGEGIIEGETWKYQVTRWQFNAERPDGRKETIIAQSNAHHLPDKERDKEEAFKNGLKLVSGSGWFYTKAKYLGKRAFYRPAKYERPTEQAKIPFVKEALPEKVSVIKESLQEKRTSIAIAMKAAGYTALETAKALMEV